MQNISRRFFLRLFGLFGLTAISTRCGDVTPVTSTDTDGDGITDPGTCLETPTEMPGPFPADGGSEDEDSTINVLTEEDIVRSDIRTSIGDFDGDAVGVPVEITITLVNTNNNCAKLKDYAFYIWQSNNVGQYSLYGPDVQDENYLRGVQVSDSNGQITFTTIFPAAYGNRWPHMHFEVFKTLADATTYQNMVLSSQFPMPKAVALDVYDESSDYATSQARFDDSRQVSDDTIFSNNTTEQLTWMTPTFTGSPDDGYKATVIVGLAV